MSKSEEAKTKSMNEETTMQIIEDDEIEVVDERKVKFGKQYIFDGDIYTELDLSRINDLTSRDMIEAEKRLNRTGDVSLVKEMTLEYALYIAAKATNLPVEFFYDLRPSDALKVKNRVQVFFYGAD